MSINPVSHISNSVETLSAHLQPRHRFSALDQLINKITDLATTLFQWLRERSSEAFKQFYEFLGLSTGSHGDHIFSNVDENPLLPATPSNESPLLSATPSNESPLLPVSPSIEGRGQLKATPEVKGQIDAWKAASALEEVNSAQLIAMNKPINSYPPRSEFLQQYRDGNEVVKSSPAIFSKSPFVSDKMVQHLIQDKKNTAIAVKYRPGDKITNMEGALHTFLTPMSLVAMTGDYCYRGFHDIAEFPGNQYRKVLLSAAIHPDFELTNVLLPVVKLSDQKVVGADLTE